MDITMRDYREEFEKRVTFIKKLLSDSGAKGIVYGNSGGKDCSLVSILCKAACDNTLGIIMPCSSRRNFGMDTEDGLTVARQYGIETRSVDLTAMKELCVESFSKLTELSDMAKANINPRLRMITLYTVAASEGRLVAGTGNRSESYMGYFTKWGDGACDFNPIADLTVKEVYEFLEYLKAPRCVIDKAPSAALFEGQTDEQEMGISYASIDRFLLEGQASPEDMAIMERYHRNSEHKRHMPTVYEG